MCYYTDYAFSYSTREGKFLTSVGGLQLEDYLQRIYLFIVLGNDDPDIMKWWSR